MSRASNIIDVLESRYPTVGLDEFLGDEDDIIEDILIETVQDEDKGKVEKAIRKALKEAGKTFEKAYKAGIK